MKKNAHDLLLQSFDALLNDQEQAILNRALSDDVSLQLEKERLQLMRRALQSTPRPAFPPFFSNRVMGRVRDLQANAGLADPFFESLKSAFKPVMALSLILLVGIISYNNTSNRDETLAGLLPSEEIAIEQAFTPTFE